VAIRLRHSGHRNPLGIAFDEQGTLGLRDGAVTVTKLNRHQLPRYLINAIFVSEGEHYNGTKIPVMLQCPSFRPLDFAVPAI